MTDPSNSVDAKQKMTALPIVTAREAADESGRCGILVASVRQFDGNPGCQAAVHATGHPHGAKHLDPFTLADAGGRLGGSRDIRCGVGS